MQPSFVVISAIMEFESFIQQAAEVSHRLDTEQGLHALRITAQFQEELTQLIQIKAHEQISKLHEALAAAQATTNSTCLLFSNYSNIRDNSESDLESKVIKIEPDSINYVEPERHNSLSFNASSASDEPDPHHETNVYSLFTVKETVLSSDLSEEKISCIKSFPNTCQLCGTVFARRGGLAKHMRCVHSASRPHGCNLCTRRFINLSTMIKHQQNCQGVGGIQQQQAKVVPVKSPHKWFPCDQCGKQFFNYAHYIRHKNNVHSADRPHGCPLCKRRFMRASMLMRHKVHCGSAVNLQNLKTDDNKSITAAFVCKNCPAQFYYSYSLLRHERKVHGITNNSSPQLYKCSECPARFAKPGNLKKHEIQLHKVQVNNDSNDYHAKSENPITGHSFSSKISSNVLDTDIVNKLRCNKCNKKFLTFASLIRHKQSHTSSKKRRDVNLKDNFKCNICHVSCVSSDGLQRHLRFHTDERPFVCSECGMSFHRKDYLQNHQRRAHIKRFKNSDANGHSVNIF